MKVLETYTLMADGVPAKVRIISEEKEFVPIYELQLPKIEPGTQAILGSIRERLIAEVRVKAQEILDPKAMEELKDRFFSKSLEFIEREFSRLTSEDRKALAGILLHDMLGLGEIEVLLKDDNLEEIVINNSEEPVWVYHKKVGWAKTTLMMKTETQIYNYASLVGRKVGRQITTLNPLMDAHLISGDRVNATLHPISTKGNTMTIRKFARNPWTLPDFIINKTINGEVSALLWLAMQYELNMIISGGTATGKTSFLNVLSTFIQPTQRIISIEDTREIQLPDFMHWVPLTTREANPEGKGEVSMLDLMINSLRMRPDRIVVGEIRRAREAEVLFEAMHTGHSVYSTLHAETADQTIRRMMNPPIDVPATLLESVHLIAVMHRDRRKKIRRIFEVAEVIAEKGGEAGIKLNVLYRWRPDTDTIIPYRQSERLIEEIKLYTGMTDQEIKQDLQGKQKVFEYMIKNGINTINTVGKVVSEYYLNPSVVFEHVRRNLPPDKLLGEFAREVRGIKK